MPSLTWKLIALLTLIFAVAVFLWMISLGPLSRCERLLSQVVDARTSHGAQMFSHRAIETGAIQKVPSAKRIGKMPGKRRSNAKRRSARSVKPNRDLGEGERPSYEV